MRRTDRVTRDGCWSGSDSIPLEGRALRVPLFFFRSMRNEQGLVELVPPTKIWKPENTVSSAGPLIGFAVSCRTQLPDVSTRPGRNRDRVSLHGCLFILVACPVCCCASRHSSSVCLAGSKGLRTHHANPTDLRNPCGVADALVVRGPRD